MNPVTNHFCNLSDFLSSQHTKLYRGAHDDFLSSFICFPQFVGSEKLLAIKHLTKVSAAFACGNVATAIHLITRGALCFVYPLCPTVPDALRFRFYPGYLLEIVGRERRASIACPIFSGFHVNDNIAGLGSSCLPHGFLPRYEDTKSKRLVQLSRELQPIMATPYISCSSRVLLGEQRVLSKNLSLSKTITYATSCRNNGYVYETFGISKHFPVKPLQSLLNVTPLKLALSAKCFIYDVTTRTSFSFLSVSVGKGILFCNLGGMAFNVGFSSFFIKSEFIINQHCSV